MTEASQESDDFSCLGIYHNSVIFVSLLGSWGQGWVTLFNACLLCSWSSERREGCASAHQTPTAYHF